MSEYTFTVEGRPRAKARPRLGKGHRAFTPATTLAAEQVIRDAYTGPTFTGPVEVEVDYHKDRQVITIREIEADVYSPLTADVDNLVKLTLDALVPDAVPNDRQVYRLKVRKVHTPKS